MGRFPRYTTLLRAIELWGAVQADGPGRLAGDEEPPAVDGFVVGREENFSQQIKADPEDGLSAAFVGLDDDRPVFRLPFTGGVRERRLVAGRRPHAVARELRRACRPPADC